VASKGGWVDLISQKEFLANEVAALKTQLGALNDQLQAQSQQLSEQQAVSEKLSATRATMEAQFALLQGQVASDAAELSRLREQSAALVAKDMIIAAREEDLVKSQAEIDLMTANAVHLEIELNAYRALQTDEFNFIHAVAKIYEEVYRIPKQQTTELCQVLEMFRALADKCREQQVITFHGKSLSTTSQTIILRRAKVGEMFIMIGTWDYDNEHRGLPAYLAADSYDAVRTLIQSDTLLMVGRAVHAELHTAKEANNSHKLPVGAHFAEVTVEVLQIGDNVLPPS